MAQRFYVDFAPGRSCIHIPGPAPRVAVELNEKLLTASQALAAVEALVAGAVAHGDVAAVGTGGGVALKARQLLAQWRKNSPADVRRVGVMAIAIPIAAAIRGVRRF